MSGAPPLVPLPPPPSAGAWQAVPGESWLCGQAHPGASPGRLDEAARRLSHEELHVATTLVGEGHDVRSLAESRRGGRTADLQVCGVPVEVKSWLPMAERGRAPTPQSVFNKLLDASGQAPAAVLDARGSGLSAATARRGLALHAEMVGRLTAARVIGDGFDLACVRRPGLGLPTRSQAPRGRVAGTLDHPAASRGLGR